MEALTKAKAKAEKLNEHQYMILKKRRLSRSTRTTSIPLSLTTLLVTKSKGLTNPG